MASGTVSRIELLSKENYDTWILQVEAILVKSDLWGYVTGEIQKPDDTIIEDLATWIKMDQKAKADIVLSIHPTELKQIRGCRTSKEVWIKLENIYASKGPARKATLLKQLMLQKLEEGGNIREHLYKFFSAVDKLESMAVNINGDMLTIMLLYSLPSSFSNFRCAIETRDELPSAESLKVKIMEESEARKHTSENAVIALAADSQKKVKTNKVFTTKNFKCFKCGKIGHKANVCYSKQKMNDTNHKNDNSVYSATVKIESSNAVNNHRGWILDSGCTTHLCGDEGAFSQIEESASLKINLANQTCAEVKGKGVIYLKNNYGHSVELRNTLLVPGLRTNLISISKITDKGHKVVFMKNNAKVYNQVGKLTLVADRVGDLFYVREGSECYVTTTVNDDLMTWHNRMGHLNFKDLLRMKDDNILPCSSKINNINKMPSCEICLKGKMTALPFDKRNKSCNDPLFIVHSDVVGPFRIRSHEGCRYFVTFIDDSTRWCEIFFLREKSGVFEAFKEFHKQIEKQTGREIKYLQSDNGGEYVNKQFDQYLVQHGIKRRLSIPHTPQQNGIAERMNRTLLDMARCMLLQSGLSLSFWSSSVATASYIRNRCPTSSLNWKTPFEMLIGKKPNINYFKNFGSKVFILNKNATKGKFAPRAIEGIFIGYPKDRKGYRIWVPEEQRMVYSRDVKFVSEENPKLVNSLQIENLLVSNKDTLSLKETHKHVLENNNEKEIEYIEYYQKPEIEMPHARIEENIFEEDVREVNSNEEEVLRNEIVVRGPGRPKIVRTGIRGRPRKEYCTRIVSTNEVQSNENDESNNLQESYTEDDITQFAGVAEIKIQDALNGPNSEDWLNAIESEVSSLIKNKTWDIVKVSEPKNIVGSRFVLTNKCDANGKIIRRKARLVAKGYSQKYGVDYHQTFAPVARLETLRLLLALSVQFKFQIWQFDVVTAYLNGYLDEEILMKIPDRLGNMLERIIDKQGKNSDIGAGAFVMLRNLREGGKACRLKKALYGLKQAGRQWYARLSDKLTKIGLKCTQNEPCLFYGKFNKDLIYVLIYVDDILIAAPNKEVVYKIKSELSKDFELKDLGMAKYCLGLQIEQNNDTIKLNQKGYINEILKKYGMYDCNSVSTPAEVNMSLDNDEPYKGSNYREIIGELMYLTVATRPDISNVISRLAQYVNNPLECHWNSIKRILRYLAGTAEFGLVYKRNNSPLIAYTDADWGGCILDRRSYTGFVFILAGSAIAWKSTKQRTVALSSTEAEYISLAEAAKETIYLRSLLNELDLKEFLDITVNVDNKGAEYLANNPVFHARTKHIDLRHHFIRQSLKKGMFKIKHVSTKDMIADIMTKPLPKILHYKCMQGLGFSM